MLETQEFKLSALERLGVAIIKMGPMPKHIAIILDGNRRFARKRKLENVTEGHKYGSKKLDEVISMLLELEVKELSVYAFSIENFKRAKEEVDALMEIFAEKFCVTEKNMTNYKRNGICIEVVGNIDDTPTNELKATLAQNMILTKENQRLKLNICFIYTGRNEIAKSANLLASDLIEDKLEIDNVTEELFLEAFNIHKSHPVDLLLRTSGESRLSDFMIWSCSEAVMEFAEETWPEFGLIGLLFAIFRYQNQILYRGLIKQVDIDIKPNVRQYVQQLRGSTWQQLQEICMSNLQLKPHE